MLILHWQQKSTNGIMSKTNLLTFMFLSLLRYRLLLRLFVSPFICVACGDVYSLTAYISLKVEGYVWKCLPSSFSRLLPDSSFPPELLVSENATIRFLFNFPYTSFCSFVDIATYRFESLTAYGIPWDSLTTIQTALDLRIDSIITHPAFLSKAPSGLDPRVLTLTNYVNSQLS